MSIYSLHSNDSWTSSIEKEILDEQDLRQKSRPSSIEDMVRITNFNRKEIQLLYRGFKEQCPNAAITPQKFLEIFNQFFRFGDTTIYAQLVFNTFDEDKNGRITFEEFVKALSILLRGTTKEKLRWIFDLYDIHKTGFLTRQNLFRVTRGIYDLIGPNTSPPILSGDVEDHVNCMFQKLDCDGDGRISLDDFLRGCENDENIVNSLSLFRFGWKNRPSPSNDAGAAQIVSDHQDEHVAANCNDANVSVMYAA